ncbi:MAG: hypothetical protein AMJ90_04995 [candidate division Zixibacteria bacterium SM23_73_2]|nr:MAG: hypothetical protein AMJ90_04995 [candidate division Zixibacteria bacterium SM23_73_2]
MKKKTTRKKKKAVSEEDFLEELIKKLLKKLNNKDYKPTVSDAIKAIQLKEKLKRTSEAEKIFWELIERIRKEELGKIEK